jgi:hypothetical protein
VADIVHQTQAAAEGVQAGDVRKVTFLGAEFATAEKIGLMPLMRFAAAAKAGLDSDDMDGLAALYTLIQDCIDPADWPRFERHATDTKAEADDLMKVVQTVIEALAARPTQRPADSSAGPPSTSAPSKGISSTPGRRVPAEAAEMVPVADLMEHRARLTG